ncbi:MAG: hypothetical protein KAJ46_01345 [Sedimentisphaerales bacterium]|nr:hypothetical protein [Sedimentisphaerales bacterium]
MRFFTQRFSAYRQGCQNGSDFCSPFSAMSRRAAMGLAMAGLLLVGIGVLVLLFPLALAVFVAFVFFLAAMGCLRWAWVVYRSGRPESRHVKHVDVETRRI